MITIAELEERAEEFEEWRLAQTSDGVTLQLDIETQEDMVEGEHATYLQLYRLDIGDMTLVTAVVVDGVVEFVEKGARIVARPTFPRRWVVETRHRAAWVEEKLPHLLLDVIEELEARGKVGLIADKKITAMVNKLREAKQLPFSL